MDDRKLIIENWGDWDNFNLEQVVLAAKFDSARKEVIGAPIANKVLRQLRLWNYSDPFLKDIASQPDKRAPSSVLSKISEASSVGLEDWEIERIKDLIVEMAYPFKIEVGDMETLLEHFKKV